jgi:hypothetical protein
MAAVHMSWAVNTEKFRRNGKMMTAKAEKSENKQHADSREWFPEKEYSLVFTGVVALAGA